ncbi:MAG: hypothetical protein IRZ20_06300 [Thermoleophilia bacterium]|nr:hypothetical protein [Thermoleophilia bacterium]
MRRAALVLATASAATLAAAGSARATSECRGLPVCVPVAGPWVLAPTRAETQYQLSCPRSFVVGGLDAELTTRALDVVFRATLGSPVNPGISTSTAAVFLGRLALGRDPAASFRPHIGCVPAIGGGQRVPTARRVFPPGRPTVRRVTEVAVRPGAARVVVRTCRAGERLVAASHAVGFYTQAPPSRALASAVRVRRSAAAGRVTVRIAGGDATRGVRAVVQLDLVCAGGR